MDTIKLGKITAPQGIKGEVRVYPYTDELTRFSEIEAVLLAGQKRKIQNARYMKNMAVLKLEGVDDRNMAESLRNKELLLAKEDLWEQPEDTYFIDDLVGCTVVSEDGAPVGMLKSIISTRNSASAFFVLLFILLPPAYTGICNWVSSGLFSPVSAHGTC